MDGYWQITLLVMGACSLGVSVLVVFIHERTVR